jgi:hypothetical protein
LSAHGSASSFSPGVPSRTATTPPPYGRGRDTA